MNQRLTIFMQRMNKVILVGKGASGKDHLRKILEGRGFTYGTSYTTRPPREGEMVGGMAQVINNSKKTVIFSL